MESTRHSRCTERRDPPLEWLDFDDDEAERPFLEWLLSLPEVDRDLTIGRIIALRQLAASGEIVDGDTRHIKPIRRDPEMWELRWSEAGALIRQYHAEPSELPRCLVRLHVHLKEIARTEPETTHLQDIEISWAMLRYRAGESSLWGYGERSE